MPETTSNIIRQGQNAFRHTAPSGSAINRATYERKLEQAAFLFIGRTSHSVSAVRAYARPCLPGTCRQLGKIAGVVLSAIPVRGPVSYVPHGHRRLAILPALAGRWGERPDQLQNGTRFVVFSFVAASSVLLSLRSIGTGQSRVSPNQVATIRGGGN